MTALTFGVGNEVMVEGSNVTTDSGSVSVFGTLGVVLVASNVERFRDHTALERDVVCRARGEAFVDAPSLDRSSQHSCPCSPVTAVA